MPLVFNLFALLFPDNIAWRVTFVVPAVVCLLVGAADYFTADDCPAGDWLELRRASKQNVPDIDEKVVIGDNEKSQKSPEKLYEEKEVEEDNTSTFVVFMTVLKSPTVWILILQYACCFGLELAVDNIIGDLFIKRFGMNQTVAGYYASTFGLMNIFSRASGGVFADVLNGYLDRGLLGRLAAHQFITFFEGVTLICFSYSTHSLATALTAMIAFSYFVQAACGTTFSVAPFVNPKHYGVLTGLVGAGGNLGAVTFNYVFKAYAGNYEAAFTTIGIVVLCVSLLTAVVKVENQMLWMLFKKRQ
jgi:NNP family nitrate/nitrite transporter-like MFS transporter